MPTVFWLTYKAGCTYSSSVCMSVRTKLRFRFKLALHEGVMISCDFVLIPFYKYSDYWHDKVSIDISACFHLARRCWAPFYLFYRQQCDDLSFTQFVLTMVYYFILLLMIKSIKYVTMNIIMDNIHYFEALQITLLQSFRIWNSLKMFLTVATTNQNIRKSLMLL